MGEYTVNKRIDKISRATIYVSGLFGYKLIEAREVTHGSGPYAQFEDAVWVEFIEKGRRKRIRITEGSHPSIVIVEGWGQPLLRDPYAEATQLTGGTLTGTRHPSCAEEWDREFEEYLSSLNAKILADFRGHDSKAR
jgi:hypothetical protein